MKKLISLILCMVMVLGLALGATAAAHTHTISIDSREGYEYEAFQIFKGDLDKTGVLANITWGSAVEANADALLAALKAKNATLFGTCNDAVDVAAALGKDHSFDNEVAKAFAEVVGAKDGSGNYLYIDASKAYKQPNPTTHTITVDHDGYYLIVNSKIPTGTDTTYSRYMLEVVRDVEVAHKGTFPTIDKKIVENGNKVSLNEASIGDVVNYEITGTLPNNLGDYNTYYYVFRDTLSKGLTYNKDSVKVTVNGVDVTDYFYVGASAYDIVHGTTVTIGIEDILRLQYVAGVGEIKGGMTDTDTKIVITYSATLNENAVIALEGNPNVVDLQYSNNPNEDGEGETTPPPTEPDKPTPKYPTGVTPKKEVKTWTTRLYIRKTDGTGTKLEGAEFKLTGTDLNVALVYGNHFIPVTAGTGDWYKLNNNSYTKTAPVYDDPLTTDVNEDTSHLYASTTADYKMETFAIMESKGASPVEVKAFVDDKGYVTFEGLGAGEYTLTETVTPAGFNTIDPITFTVTFNTEKEEFRSNNAQINVGKDKGNEHYNSLYTTVVNEAGSTLPSTGGIGTTLFYVFGSLMAVGAAVLLVTKKRMAAAE